MVGAGDAKARSFENLFVSGAYDDALAGKGPLQELTFRPDASRLFAGVLDPVLLTGDVCHTKWGWDHGVEPGSFSVGGRKSAESLAALQKLAARHPTLDVRVGHQER